MKLRIKAVAKSKKMLMKDLAEKSGIGRQLIAYYNSGKVAPPISKLEQIAVILDCDLLELIEPSKPENAHFYNGTEWKGIRN